MIFNLLVCVLVGIIGLHWGSFLNVLAYRGLNNISLFGRSRCPLCSHILAWYDLIPVFSWFILQGSCRWCKGRISLWYPFIEILTALWSILLIVLFPLYLLPALGLLSSALITTIRTDSESYLILRLCTIGIIPLGVILSACGYGLVTFSASLLGSVLGWMFLEGFAKLFERVRGYPGLGRGDIEFIAGIGSFVGPWGVWYTLLIASVSGSLYGLSLMYVSSKNSLQTPLPFGTFLALGTAVTLCTWAFF